MFKIVVLWYLFIFSLTCFWVTDIVPLSTTSIIFILLFILFFIVGGKMASQLVKRKKIEQPLFSDKNIDKLNYFIYIIIVYYCYLFYLLINFLITNGNEIFIYLRFIVFSDDTDSNPFFKSQLHLFIHRILIKPSILSMYLIGLKNHFYFYKNKLLMVSIGLLIIDSIIMFGRLNIYYMILIYIFASFVYDRHNNILKFVYKSLNIKNIGLIILVFLMLFTITLLRSSEDSEILYTSFNSFIEYNIYGFRIFDANIKDPTSIIHVHTYGRSFLGQIDAIFSILYRFTIDNNFLPANSINGKFLDTYIDFGIKETKTANAFGTLFFTFYRDFGFYGIIFYSMISGFILNYLNLKFVSTRKPSFFIIGIFIVYSLVFSVYQSVFEGEFWPMLIILLVNICSNKDRVYNNFFTQGHN